MTPETPIHRRPYHVAPTFEGVRVILTARLFMKAAGSNIGLNITASNNMKVLRRHGVDVEVWATQEARDLWARLRADHGRPITHVVISAPGWIHPSELARMAEHWPAIEFTVLNHSGLAYFSIDKFGMRNNRMGLDLFLRTHNFRMAANNWRVARWFTRTTGKEMAVLPNLYDTASFIEPVTHRQIRMPLKIGSYGAGRPWKNQLHAAEAAVEIARRLNVPLEFYVNSNRPDGGERIIESRNELFHDLAGTKTITVPWADWPRFRNIVRTMDLLISPSFDETFCVVAADGVAEGVSSIVSPAMEWTPRSWQCETHDPETIATRAIGLLHDPHAVYDGREALRRHVDAGITLWLRYLTRQPQIIN